MRLPNPLHLTFAFGVPSAHVIGPWPTAARRSPSPCRCYRLHLENIVTRSKSSPPPLLASIPEVSHFPNYPNLSLSRHSQRRAPASSKEPKSGCAGTVEATPLRRKEPGPPKEWGRLWAFAIAPEAPCGRLGHGPPSLPGSLGVPTPQF